MKSSKHICANCGTEKEIPTDNDPMFEICSDCSAMGEWAQPESEVVEEVEQEEPESTAEEETEPATDLILIKENMPLGDIWTPENVDAMIAKLEQYNKDFKGDVKTAKGRKEIISFSRKFSSGKVFVDGTAIELADEWKTKTAALNAQRRKFKDACDRLRDESRKPVTDYENAKKLVIANQGRILARLVDLYNAASDLDVAVYESYIAEVNAIVIDGDDDFIERGSREKEQTLKSLEEKLAAKIKHDKDQADLAKLREAEEKRKAEETKKAEIEERKNSDEQIKLQAEKDAQKKIDDAKEKEETAKAEKIEAEKKAEKDKIEAAAKADQEKKEAIEVERKKADQKEADRLAEVAEERKADEVRAADKEHRTKINNEITVALMRDCNVNSDQVTDIIAEVLLGNIPHLSIKY